MDAASVRQNGIVLQRGSAAQPENTTPRNTGLEAKAVNTPRTTKLRRPLWRWIGPVAAVCVVAWIGLVLYVDSAMRQTPEKFGRIMARMPMPAFLVLPFETLWTHERAGHLKPGDTAPEFTLKQLQGSEAPVQLASLWSERPVVLVFGSYT